MYFLKECSITSICLLSKDRYFEKSKTKQYIYFFTKKFNDIGNLDLSGTLEDGKRVMSIVQNPRNVSQNSLDPYLTWDIPESWSLEDAATVPWAYSTAYHSMIQAAVLSSQETVLIHAGHTPIGQAAIAFALHIGSIVFTTVTETVHKEFLMKRFPLLQEKNILRLASNIDITLMQETIGEGVNVLINCLRGSKLHSSLQCVSVCGRFVQIGMTDMEENTRLMHQLIVLDKKFSTSHDLLRKDLNSMREIQEAINSQVFNQIEVQPTKVRGDLRKDHPDQDVPKGHILAVDDCLHNQREVYRKESQSVMDQVSWDVTLNKLCLSQQLE
uniref:Enoyl reductase (ER) domain-containing protein n=1 Tax=Timema douglasi TaxID=61478 RepID=A0A7R8ZDM6_TIMDO|nr:unnamed protein product [Timema douglasi]